MKIRIITLTAIGGASLALATATAQPTILTQPTNQSVSLNATVQFKLTARSSGGTLSYQWRFKDAALDPALNPSAAKSTLLVSNVTETMAGAYHAVVSDDNGSVTSQAAQLTVDPMFTKVVQGALVTDRAGSTTATWIDYDQDGYLDLFVGNADNTGTDVLNALYRNNQDGTFSKITTNAVATARGQAWGVGWGDCDEDGRPDLFVAQTGTRNDHLFHNLGGGAFQLLACPPITTDRLDSIMPLWGDYNLDGYLDLFLSAGYWSGPQNDRLYQNTGSGQFRLTTSREVGDVVEDNARSLAFGWIDYDQDGDIDLFASYTVLFTVGAQTTNYVFANNLQGPMERQALPALDAVGQAWGMSWGDFDNDGYPDLFLPAFLGTNALFRNLQGKGFVDVSETAGLKLAMASNASAWGDVDNDGWLDLFVANYQDAGFPNFPGGHALFRNNRDGTFFRVTTGSPAHEGGRACAVAWGDYDNDGFLDLYIACGDGVAQPNLLYRNNGNANHWLKVGLRGSASNRLGIGAKVRILARIGGQPLWQTRTISGQHSWISGDGLLAHFGLGDATVAEVIRVEWPSGHVQEFTNQPVDRVRTITETIRIAPVRPTASLGASLTLTNRYGTGTYQWRFNGVDLAGQIKKTLTLTNLQAAHQGRYSVVVTGSAGTVITNFAYLIVDPTFTKITEGPVVNDPVDSLKPIAIQGGAWADYDNDGFIDLVLANDPWPDPLTPKASSLLYRNLRDGTFRRVPDSPVSAEPGHWAGCAWADTDNDGLLDLYMGETSSFVGQGNSHSCYLRNLGNGTFEGITDDALANQIQMSAVPVWGDYDNDGYVDLFITSATSAVGTSNLLYRNEGAGKFNRVTQGPVATSRGDTLWGSWSDYDNDGLLDLLVNNQGGAARLFHNDGAGQFTRITRSTIYQEPGSAGAAWGDYDNDGDLDLCLVSYFDNCNVFTSDGQGGFTRMILPQKDNYQVPNWVDYDNDGYLDLFVAVGPGQNGVNRLFRNNGDRTFTYVPTGSIAGDVSYAVAAAWGDYDNNGFLDLLVANGYATNVANYLYRNNGNGNSWLTFKLAGTTSNRAAIGAKVRLQARIGSQTFWQMRELCRGSFLQDDLRLHFGLGNATKANIVRIEWPSGIVQELRNVAANQILTVTEPPRLESLGQGRLRILCWARQNYEIEASDDLDTWRSLGVVAHDLNRPEVIDPGAAGHPYRFYRAVER